jgi:hypothetical protein
MPLVLAQCRDTSKGPLQRAWPPGRPVKGCCNCNVPSLGCRRTPLRPLKTGTFIYAERPAGHHDLSASMQLFSGDTHVDVAAESGRTYFFLTRPSDKAKTLYAMSAAGGIAGLVVGAAVTSNNKNPGPLDFFPMDDASARDMMNDLRVSD